MAIDDSEKTFLMLRSISLNENCQSSDGIILTRV